MSNDPVVITTVEILRAYLDALPRILAGAALFDALCWLGIALWWARRQR